jgi:hypothetical protein
VRALWLVVVLLCCQARSAFAQDSAGDFTGLTASPYANEVRSHYYETLRRSPGKAVLWELALPGAGNVYTGIYVNAIVTGVITLAGTGLWIAGAVKDNDALWWSGAGTFAAGRVYGLVSAPIGAGLLNAAYRQHFGITSR